ncbi:MAG: hypothetical protein RQ723_09065 [Desulfuromonadales bacterium]|nr:hypothetical protein [Desulfuromonadales bacterium]
MLSRLLILLLLLLPLGAGCASRWEHEIKGRAGFYQDDLACQSIAGSATVAIEPGRERVSYESCMWDKGWRKK